MYLVNVYYFPIISKQMSKMSEDHRIEKILMTIIVRSIYSSLTSIKCCQIYVELPVTLFINTIT